ncbi:class F sortase [Crossiella sp. SN42]|uniref:class F sortase n=1 Tax=Crossiella sp. SN42 TaxID=2944808 RepID=UPI00207D6150|nr:class F sortase [Crossiella sp. SN42]MCO1577083.1 class F sortase [Crossiella sp. SN42]
MGRSLYPGETKRDNRARVAGLGLLGVALACLAAGLSASQLTTTVVGEPVAVENPPPSPLRARPLTDLGDAPLIRWGQPGGGNPAQPTTTTTTPPKPGQPNQITQPAGGQRPGTVRLPEGGTATLVRREVAPDGVLPVPDGVRDATWWGAGLDAAKGATVLAGHVNWKGATGPFAELWRSDKGQQVTVKDATGKTHNYRITEVHTVHKDQLPQRAETLFAQTGNHRLVLVTCGGEWVGGQLGYDDNRIVVAERA